MTRNFLVVAALALGSMAAQAQFTMLHIGNVAVGGSGQFSKVLTANPQSTPLASPNSGINAFPTRQDTTWSAGFVGSLQMHPKPWAGVQINYGFTHYQERYSVIYSNTPNLLHSVAVPVDMHEATAGYLFHPKYIPFKPYMVIGGGAIDFNPRGGVTQFTPTTGTHQWRGAGYLETGIDLPTHSKHIGFRIAGRSLYYRAPNFDTPQISTRSWRATVEPTVSAVYKF